MPHALTVRPATLADLPGVYRVCLQTGDAGGDATALWRDPDLLGHVWAGPYVVGAPEHARVVTHPDSGVCGYLFGCADTRAFEAWQEAAWWPQLRAAYPPRDDDSPEADLVRVIHHRHLAPDDIVAAYPAHLHIDLLPVARGLGLGRVLIDGLLADLRAQDVAGIHLDVAASNANAIAFYEHLGFSRLRPFGDGGLLMGLRLA